jgi:transposase
VAVLSPCCGGLDVHQKMVVACLVTTQPQPSGHADKVLRTYGTMPQDLLALADWLKAAGCIHGAMESTGVFWKPIDHLFAGLFELLVVNAQPLQAVPGRKTRPTYATPNGWRTCCATAWSGPVLSRRRPSARCAN